MLNVVFAAPEGERLDTPERRAAIEDADRAPPVARVQARATARPGSRASATRSASDTFSDDGRIAYAEAQFNETIEDEDREQVVAVQDAVRETVEPAGVTVEYNGEAEFPPIEQGTSEALGLLAAIIVLLLVFRTFTAMLIPIALAISALVTAFLLLFILAGLTDINTITPILVSMIGLGVGIDYSLFIVTRFRQLLHDGLSPRDAAAEAGASAGRAVLFAGLTVAISVTGLAFIGLDFVTKLGIGSALGVLTTVLIANSLLPAVLALLGHKIDRLKVPVPAPGGRLRGGAREDARRALGPLRDRARAASSSRSSLVLILALAATSRSCASAPPTRARSPRSRRAAAPTTCSPRASGPASTARSRSSSTSTATPQAPQRIFDGVAGPAGRGVRRRAAAQRRGDGRRSSS